MGEVKWTKDDYGPHFDVEVGGIFLTLDCHNDKWKCYIYLGDSSPLETVIPLRSKHEKAALREATRRAKRWLKIKAQTIIEDVDKISEEVE